MRKNEDRICPVSHAKNLVAWWRMIFHKPKKILNSLVKNGNQVIDFGCGPGYFTIPLAQLVGESGKVMAVDIQLEMLAMVKERALKARMVNRLDFVLSDKEIMGIRNRIDFVLIFWVLHEVVDRNILFHRVYEMLKNNGKVLLSEPWFHVSRKKFKKYLLEAEMVGFKIEKLRHISLSRSVLLKKT